MILSALLGPDDAEGIVLIIGAFSTMLLALGGLYIQGRRQHAQTTEAAAVAVVEAGQAKEAAEETLVATKLAVAQLSNNGGSSALDKITASYFDVAERLDAGEKRMTRIDGQLAMIVRILGGRAAPAPVPEPEPEPEDPTLEEMLEALEKIHTHVLYGKSPYLN